MAACMYCGNPAGDVAVCTYCSQRLGLSQGAGVRGADPCRRCNHPQLAMPMPMGVTADPVPDTNLIRSRVTGVAHVDPERVHGVLEMYVCRRCGFTEWFCRDPENIPIGEQYGTELIDVSPTTPYR